MEMENEMIEKLLNMNLSELIAMLSKKGSGKIKIEVGKAKRPTRDNRSLVSEDEPEDGCSACGQDDQMHCNSSYS